MVPAPPPRKRRQAVVLPLAALSAVLAGPAMAQTPATKTLGNWTVAPSRDDGGCFITRRYDGPGETILMLGLAPDGSNHLSVLNGNWSIASKQVLALEFRLSRGGYGDHRSIGIEADGKRGFVATFEYRFPEYFAGSSRLDIFRGTTPVARLDLAGSGAAVAELRRCTAAQAAVGGPRTTVTDVPLDPFAAESSRRKKR